MKSPGSATSSTGSRAKVPATRAGVARAPAIAALVACAGCTIGFLVRQADVRTLTGLTLFLGASVSYAALLWILWRRGGLSCAVVFVSAALLMLVAIAIKPLFSNDLWAYATYGRIFSIHHASPYVAYPADFPADTAFIRMSHGFAHTRSVYGPLFTLISGIGVWIFRSPLGMRLFFQGLSAGAVLLALGFVWHGTRDPISMALFGLNPVILTGVVNGGHNDPLVALGLLAAVLLARKQKFAYAGAAAALAALVKITSLLGLGALVIWAWRKHGRRAAALTAAGGAAVTVVGYALGGGLQALVPVRAAHRLISRTSIWRMSHGWLPKVGIQIALPVVVALAVVWAFRARSVTSAVTLGLAAYLLAGAYILPWYIVWILPLVALGADWDLRVGAAALGILFQLSYFPIPDETGGSVHGASLFALHVVQLLLIAVLFARAFATCERRPAAAPA